MTIQNVAYAIPAASEPLKKVEIETRSPVGKDVLVRVMFCGICHSDVHHQRNEFPTSFPLVPGHEFTGIVESIGSDVTKHRIGDRVAIGCVSAACQSCDGCSKHEIFCSEKVMTYGGVGPDGKVTTGGHAKFAIAHEGCVLHLPEALPLDSSAPLLCAGITTYSPLVRHGMNKGGFKVGVIGMGGLGHMAVQFASKMGNEVTAITRTAAKEELSRKLGASHILLSTNEEAMKSAQNTLDFIIDTVACESKDLTPYLALLKFDGIFSIVGATIKPLEVPCLHLLMKRLTIEGSCIGSIKETQEMLEFCAEKNITAMVEKINCDQINKAYERVVNSDVQFRFVIDINGSIDSAESQ